jgi:hypothetical protein
MYVSSILLITLAAVVCLSLFPNQDLLFLLSIAIGAYLTIPVFVKKEVKTAIGGRILKWPLEYLQKATRSCGLAAILFGLQYIDNVSPSTIFPSSDIFGYAGLFVGAIAAFYSGCVVEFILNKNFQPPVNLRLVFLGTYWVVVDYLTVFVARLFYPFFGTNFVAAGFILLTIPSVISSILNWWMDRKGYSGPAVSLSILFSFLPFIWVIVMGVLLSAANYLGL